MRPDEPSPGLTRRQQLRVLLAREECGFDELRLRLAVSVRQLEDDLRHVERSVRRGPARLRIEPPRCRACGFAFRSRGLRHLHTPGRCPRCKDERIEQARFRIEERQG